MPGNQPIVPAAGQTVYLDGGSPTTANPYAFTNIPAGSHAISVTVPVGYEVGSTLCYNSTACHSELPVPGSSRSVDVPGGGFADLWWHYTPIQADPWTKAEDGDIHANALISFFREAPAGEYHGQYLISSGATIGPLVSSGQNWLVPFYPGIAAPTYDRLLAGFGRTTTLPPGSAIPSDITLVNGGVYRVTGSEIIEDTYDVPANTNALIFVDGDLRIKAEVRVPDTSSLTLIVRDRILIDKQLNGGSRGIDRIQATLIAGGSINTAHNRTSPTEEHRQLVVEGSLISLQSTVYLYRNLGDAGNGTDPAELIRPRIRNLILSKIILAKPKVFWREVPAGF